MHFVECEAVEKNRIWAKKLTGLIQQQNWRFALLSASLGVGLSAGDCGSLCHCQLSVCWFDPAQTRTSAPKTMVVASTNVSTPLGATCASAEMASYCMKMAMTVKKVKSPLLPLGKPRYFKHWFRALPALCWKEVCTAYQQGHWKSPS